MIRRLLLTLALCFLAANAQAFPSTPVLDTFTGCTDTTTPPNSNWTNAVLVGATSTTVDCEDLAATSTVNATEGDAYWNVSTFAANSEAYAKWVYVATVTDGIRVCVRLADIGANTTDGYCVLSDDPTDILYLSRIDNGAAVDLGSNAQVVTIGDQVGISAIGDQICSWYKVGAGAWTQIRCTTDSTYTAGGRIGMAVYGDGTIGTLDDFGGGTVPGGHGRTVTFE